MRLVDGNDEGLKYGLFLLGQLIFKFFVRNKFIVPKFLLNRPNCIIDLCLLLLARVKHEGITRKYVIEIIQEILRLHVGQIVRAIHPSVC